MGLFKRFVGNGQKSSEAEHEGPTVQPRHVTGAEFDSTVLKSELPVVVDFWAEWCSPCHMIAPSVAELATEYDGRVLVAKLNADEHPEILGRYGIMGIPTLIYFKGGQEVDRVVGVTGYSVLKSKLERVLA